MVSIRAIDENDIGIFGGYIIEAYKYFDTTNGNFYILNIDGKDTCLYYDKEKVYIGIPNEENEFYIE